MAEHGSQPGDGLSPDGTSNGGPSEHGGQRPSSPPAGFSHLVPAPSTQDAGASASTAGTSGASTSGPASGAPLPLGGGRSNGEGNGQADGGSNLSVDDPRTRLLLEQLLQTVSTESRSASLKEEQQSPPLIGQIWMALRRRWKPMALVFLLSLAAISWKLRPVGVAYVSTATMLLPRSATSAGNDLGAITGQRDAPGSTLDTQIAIIQSGPFVAQVREAAAQRLKRQNPGAVLTPAQLAAINGADIKATAPVSPELISITATTSDAYASIALANVTIYVYGQRLVNSGNEEQRKDVAFVEKQRDIVFGKLNEAKAALQDFKEKKNIFDVQEALARSSASVESLSERQRAANIEAQAGIQAASVSGDGIAQSFRQRASEARLKYADVLRDFFEGSPEGLASKAQLDAAEGLYQQRVNQIVRQNQQAARDVTTALVGAEQRAARLPALERKMSQLQDEVGQAATTYGQLSTRYTSLALSQAAKPASSRAIEFATGALEVRRRWLNAVLTGGLCALVLAALCALMLEQLDHSLHSVSDLEPLIPAAVLGTMPLLRGRSERRLAQMTGAQPMAPRVLEACRIVRSNLSFATMDSPAQTILITSAAPGEGKSLSALNLATVTAFDGRRVLLLDCDLRRPSQHSLNGLPLEPGFTNLLSGEAGIDDALQATRVNNLSVMTAGTLPLNPPELLGSPEARRMMQEFKERFDVIVIDSPPVLALTDAQVMCSQVDGVVMIVAAESTSKQEVQRAQAMLRHAGGRLLGAVFNKVRRGDAAPGYGTYASYGPSMLGRDRSLSDSVGTLDRR